MPNIIERVASVMTKTELYAGCIFIACLLVGLGFVFGC